MGKYFSNWPLCETLCSCNLVKTVLAWLEDAEDQHSHRESRTLAKHRFTLSTDKSCTRPKPISHRKKSDIGLRPSDEPEYSNFRIFDLNGSQIVFVIVFAAFPQSKYIWISNWYNFGLPNIFGYVFGQFVAIGMYSYICSDPFHVQVYHMPTTFHYFGQFNKKMWFLFYLF